MKIIINDEDSLSKKIKRLICKLVKTANKYSNFNVRKSQVEISFVNKDKIKELNRTYRNIDKETDVLSFPNLNLKPLEKGDFKNFLDDVDPLTHQVVLGDIIICEDVAKANAKEYNHSYERELCYLIVHGFLHLLGFDHMEEKDKKLMREHEEKVLNRYKITRDF